MQLIFLRKLNPHHFLLLDIGQNHPLFLHTELTNSDIIYSFIPHDYMHAEISKF